MNGKILAVIETDEGRVRESSFEVVELARHLAADGDGSVCAAVLGADPAGAAAEVARRGAEKVYAVQDPLLAHYTADGHTAALAALMAGQRIGTVLFAHTPTGWDVAPRLAAR
ncbi:MAG: electron transfer flavoprotein subunit alpha/FixB family protein, partial [Acidobacteriota bacterium]